MDANMACQQNKMAAPFQRLTQEEIDGAEAGLNLFFAGCNPLIKIIRMARECIRLREALRTVKFNLERQQPDDIPAICTYIDGHLAD